MRANLRANEVASKKIAWEGDKHTDRQTDRHTDMSTTRPTRLRGPSW